ncbi:hypothetical protein DFS34DRAFT_93068 [Phlyctochytrium arcticum]|nr:hypothetical protein DFS34DRAFT_93068 [Phlyctochytrium arcticum]
MRVDSVITMIDALPVQVVNHREESAREAAQITASLQQLNAKIDDIHRMLLPRLEQLETQNSNQTVFFKQLHQLTLPFVQHELQSPPSSEVGQSVIIPLQSATQPLAQSSSSQLSQQDPDQSPQQVQSQPEEQPQQQSQQHPDTVYILNKSARTVVDLWNEYNVGFADGPAIKDLERAKEGNPAFNWHGKGMAQGKNSKQWCRRKYIIQTILKIAAEKGIPEKGVAVLLEKRRRSESCKANKKAREGATLQAINDILKTDNDRRRTWLGQIPWARS